MSMQTLYPFQGQQYTRPCLQIVNLDGTNATGIYTSGSVLSATFWEGQNQISLFSPTVAWCLINPITQASQTGYMQGQFSWAVSGAQMLTLNPAGEYYTLISQTTAGVTSPVWQGRVKVLATSGSTSPQPPDLATCDFIEAYCSSANLTDTQRDFIPYFATAASTAIRKWCARDFDLRTYVKKYDVTIYGVARLDAIPVQQVLRVQGPQQLALTIANGSSSVQFAQAYFAYTGQVDGYGAQLQTATGITLNWVSNGTVVNQTVGYTTGMTISTLAAAINAVGSGWSAVADATPGGYGSWPVTELDGGYVGQGSALSAVPGTGAQFYVLQDLSTAYLDDPQRGFLNVGRQQGNFNAGRWGPGGEALWGTSGAPPINQVKVTFTAGQATVPMEIQAACAGLVKWKIELAAQELLLKSETAADYSYTLSEQMVASMPVSIRQALAPFRIFYA